MKSQFITLALGVWLSVPVLAQTKPITADQSYVIKGQITGLGNETVYLYRPSADGEGLDSVAVKATNGSFRVKGVMIHPDFYSVGLGGRSQRLSILMKPGTTVTIMAQKDSLSKGIITGAPLNADWQRHRDEMDQEVGRKLEDIEKKYAALRTSPTAKLPDSLRSQQSAEVQAAFKKADTIAQKFIRENPNREISAFMAMQYYSMDAASEKLAGLYRGMSPAVQNSYYGQQIKNLLADQAKIGLGRMAPEFTMADTTGKPLALSSLRGKYVLVDFWASWCGPCRKENPNVVAAYTKFHDKGLEILGVSLDTKKSLWAKAIQADKLGWQHVSDLKGWKNEAAALYVVKSVPTSFLLDRNGKIIAKNLRGDALHKKLAELLNQP